MHATTETITDEQGTIVLTEKQAQIEILELALIACCREAGPVRLLPKVRVNLDAWNYNSSRTGSRWGD